jgi:vancomycin resistance protein YoaR
MTTVPAQEPRPPVGAAPYRKKSTPNPWFIRIPVLFIIGGFLLVIVLAAFVAAFQLRYADKIVPGVSAFNLDLSGMTPDEAKTALASRFTYDKQAVFTFRDGDRFWQMTAGALGVSFDLQGTVDQAYTAGHSGNIMSDLVNQATIWLNGRGIAPIVRYDQNVAVARLQAIAKEVDRAPANAQLTINGRNVSTKPSLTGRTLDIPTTLSRLDESITHLTTGTEIALVVNETPPVVWDAEAAARKVRVALSAPITLTADDNAGGTLGPWTASADQIAALLNVGLHDNGDGTQSYDVSIDMSAFQGFLDSLAPGLIASPKDARYHFNENILQLEVIQPAVSGRALNVAETLKRLEQAVFTSDSRTVAMAFDYQAPRYGNDANAAAMGITQLVSQGTTYFTGSPANRRANIAEAASRFDGIVVGPGEEFSYNYWLGDVSPEDGFVEGLIISGNRTVKGVGGGICQVSTTAFRAAFWAGYPILERYAHGYRVGYYERGDNGDGVGMDAAIFTPDFDFRFQNDTPYSLLIETFVYPGNDAVQFRFYSTNPGRKVVKDGPYITNESPALPTKYEPNAQLQQGQQLQVDWAAKGAEVRVYRLIEDASGNVTRKDTFYSNYQPWGAIVQVAPGDPLLAQHVNG